MDYEKLLTEIKARQLITGSFHDAALRGLIEDAVAFITAFGVDPIIIEKNPGAVNMVVEAFRGQAPGERKIDDYTRQYLVSLSYQRPIEEGV